LMEMMMKMVVSSALSVRNQNASFYKVRLR